MKSLHFLVISGFYINQCKASKLLIMYTKLFFYKDRLVGGKFGVALPQLVFGSLSIIGGIAAIFLPETLNKFLPETIEQGENFGKYVIKLRCNF